MKTLTLETQCAILGRLLYFFAFYTLTIKYFIPIGWAIHLSEPLTTYIFFWDAWWIAHIAVGYGLIHLRKGTWQWAMLLTLAEIIIIVSKFVLYYFNPNLDFWHWMWFVNKCFLLLYFLFLFIRLLRKDVRQVI